jgi:CRISPR-associated protein (Cas_Csd1)
LELDTDCPIARYGYSEQKVAFAVVLNIDGTLAQFEDIRTVKGKTVLNRPIVVPGQAKSSGSGLNPCFLWDNTAYLLGFKEDDPKPERTKEVFNAFREKHKALGQSIARNSRLSAVSSSSGTQTTSPLTLFYPNSLPGSVSSRLPEKDNLFTNTQKSSSTGKTIFSKAISSTSRRCRALSLESFLESLPHTSPPSKELGTQSPAAQS